MSNNGEKPSLFHSYLYKPKITNAKITLDLLNTGYIIFVFFPPTSSGVKLREKRLYYL